MPFLDDDYPGRGMLTKLAICALLASLAFIGIFWANNERHDFLDEYYELVDDPDYPNPFLQEQAAEKRQEADFYNTVTVSLFIVSLAAFGTACYFALKLKLLQAWQTEWERVSYYLNLFVIWVIAIISLTVVLLLLGWLLGS